MSRIGKAPVHFDDKVKVSVLNSLVSVKGAKETLSIPLRPEEDAKNYSS